MAAAIFGVALEIFVVTLFVDKLLEADKLRRSREADERSKEMEDRQTLVFRRLIAEGLQRRILDQCSSVARLVTATANRNQTQREIEELRLNESNNQLEEFAMVRLPIFDQEHLDKLGEVIQGMLYLRNLASDFDRFLAGHPVALVLHGPILTAVTTKRTYDRLTGNEPGVAVRSLSEWADVFESVSIESIKLTEEFVTSYTQRVWDLSITSRILESAATTAKNSTRAGGIP